MDLILLPSDYKHQEGLSRNIYQKCYYLSHDPDLRKWVVILKIIVLTPDNENSNREKHLVTWEDELFHATHFRECFLEMNTAREFVTEGRFSAHENDVVNQEWASSKEEDRVALDYRILKSLFLQVLFFAEVGNILVSYIVWSIDLHCQER